VSAQRQRLSTADLTASTTEDSKEDALEEKREAGDVHDDAIEPLLPSEDCDAFQSRWKEIQVRFVDEPQGSVQDADSLVAEVMQRLAATFAEERARLEREWGRGAEVSTEDLRQSLRHYRSFFDRLLSA
jgi:hypothetical protein